MKHSTRQAFRLDYKGGCTALCTVLAWLATFACSLLIRNAFPNFDGMPLMLILMATMALLCAVNRIAARIYARNHFGIPPSERRGMLRRHADETRADTAAVMAKFEGMETVPTFLLILYFGLTFAIGSLWVCGLNENTPVWRIVLAGMASMGSMALFAMAFVRIFDTMLGQRLNKDLLVPEGSLPRLEALAVKAADAVGIKGKIRLEITRDCECNANRFGKTYVVFLGSRLLSVLTEEELYQLMLMSLDLFTHDKEYGRTLRLYRLGQLGSADIRPAFFAFDLFFSYADVCLEWEYDLYMTAFRRYANQCAAERVQAVGNPAAAATAMDKQAMWRHFAFESNVHLREPFYAPEKPEKKHEWIVCNAYRVALPKRYKVWRRMLEEEISAAADSALLYREMRRQVLPCAEGEGDRVEIPDLTTEYGTEVQAALDIVENRLYNEIRRGYAAARKEEYLDLLDAVSEYEGNPTGYTTPELSPVINAYRDLCLFEKAEALCDGILATEENRFARAHAAYFKGMCRIHRYDTGGIDLIYQAIDLNKNYMEDGFAMVEEYCTMNGLADEYEAFLRRAEAQMAAHAMNHEGAGTLSPMDHLVKEEELGDMLPDILAYMEQVSEGRLEKVYLVRKVISEDFFSSVFVVSFAREEGWSPAKAYNAIFNYLDAYPVDWQFSFFLTDPNTLRAVQRVEGSLVWEKKDS